MCLSMTAGFGATLAAFEFGPAFECRPALRKIRRNAVTLNVAGAGNWAAMTEIPLRSRTPERHYARPAEVRCKAKPRSSVDLAAAIRAALPSDALEPTPIHSVAQFAERYRPRRCESRSAYPK